MIGPIYAFPSLLRLLLIYCQPVWTTGIKSYILVTLIYRILYHQLSHIENVFYLLDCTNKTSRLRVRNHSTHMHVRIHPPPPHTPTHVQYRSCDCSGRVIMRLLHLRHRRNQRDRMCDYCLHVWQFTNCYQHQCALYHKQWISYK